MKAGKLIGEAEVVPTPSLGRIRESGGTWAAYQNHDLGHKNCGHVTFLKYGPDCTYAVPPRKHPDTPKMFGWRYVYVGIVNLDTGKIE